MGHQWFQALRPSELKKAELERTRASVEQVVGNNTLHRW
jgi:hypothetical protein